MAASKQRSRQAAYETRRLCHVTPTRQTAGTPVAGTPLRSGEPGSFQAEIRVSRTAATLRIKVSSTIQGDTPPLRNAAVSSGAGCAVD